MPDEVTEGRHIDMVTEAVELTDDMIGMLDGQFSDLTFAEEGGIDDIEEWLTSLKNKILHWHSDESMIWDRGTEEASQYLHLVNEIRQLDDILQKLNFIDEEEKQRELVNCVQSILQMAMARLEDEFVHLLLEHRQIMQHDELSFRSTEDYSMDDFSCSSFERESVDGRSPENPDREEEETVIDLIHPRVVCDLKSIAKLMFQCGYDQECCQAYISARKDALGDYLKVLGMEKFSIEEILNMEWKILSRIIRMWKNAMDTFVRVYLGSERRLCDLIFGEISRSVRESCFVETSKCSIFQLLSFAEAVAISPPKSERIFQILDIYDSMKIVIQKIEYFFPEDYGYIILTECREVLIRLSESIRGIIKTFKYAIQSNTSTSAFASAVVLPLTKYVMNYIKALVAYSKTIDVLLEDQHSNDRQSSTDHNSESISCSISSPLAREFKLVTSILEKNLNDRSNLYNDNALQNIFLMNNVCYMVKKVKSSELQKFLGDGWIRQHNAKLQQYSTRYQRASWYSVLLFLRDEGNSNAVQPSVREIKERFRGFNHAFEEVYRVQTGWLVPDPELREDLRIKISLNVLQAYRMFMGRHATRLDGERHKDRFIKYDPDDLDDYLLDLFEGSQKLLQYPHRR